MLTCGADPLEITEALRGALLTDAEVAAGEAAWRRLPDPFGWFHTEWSEGGTSIGTGPRGDAVLADPSQLPRGEDEK